jgi:polyisoprenoid-binding protein YceI
MLRQHSKFRIMMGAAVMLGCTGLAQADWATLDSANSTVSYVSIKLNEISEVHSFNAVSGSISDSEKVSIQIEAASINSGIEIRDDRMREFLFAVTDYPEITISANIDINAIPSGVTRMQFPAIVTIKNIELPITVDAFVSLGPSAVTVSSATPVIVSTGQAGLSEGVAQLSELAGGIVIGSSVPVSFFLSFDRL